MYEVKEGNASFSFFFLTIFNEGAY